MVSICLGPDRHQSGPRLQQLQSIVLIVANESIAKEACRQPYAYYALSLAHSAAVLEKVDATSEYLAAESLAIAVTEQPATDPTLT